jgi:cytochrome c556
MHSPSVGSANCPVEKPIEMWKSRSLLTAIGLFFALGFAFMAPVHLSANNTTVVRQLNPMNTANAALVMLGNMSSGRIAFDQIQARFARRKLVKALRTIPRDFRRNRDDPASHAKPEIWSQWEVFLSKAHFAKRAALAIRVNSRSTLQGSLPRMLLACTDCHQRFREPDG